MSAPLFECAELAGRLRDDVDALAGAAAELEVASPVGSEWYELLVHKLLPQLEENSPLIVAVVGGTNTGKSVVFNHIAGQVASAVSPLASGTRHPVCIVPAAFDSTKLAAVFEGFELYEWESPEDMLVECDEHRMYWRTSDSLPDNLLLLDSPDIDSDAEVNWERAARLRQSADVLVAVLTQQKYNDAAVKQFFRLSAEEDRAVLVVFNQCQFPDDEEYWPLWLETFTSETGSRPEFVYLAPIDREAAESNRLEFLGRPTAGDDSPRDLQRDLAELRFADIKVRSLQGSLGALLDPDSGLPAWLESVAERSGEFAAAAELLSAETLADIDEWPNVPARLLVDAVRGWWRSQRQGWSAGVHAFYNAIGRSLAWPLRQFSSGSQDRSEQVLAAYREAEWEAMLGAVEMVYRRLCWCRDAGGGVLGPRLEPMLEGEVRQRVLDLLRSDHAACDLAAELDEHVADELERFRDENPRSFRMLRRFDRLAAAARPATSVALFVVGFGPVGHAVAPIVTDAAVQTAMGTAVHVASDVAGGTVTATLGESALSHAAGSGIGYLETRFRNLQADFSLRRAAWLATRLQELVLGELARELQAAADVSSSTAFTQAADTARALAMRFPAIRPEPVTETP